MRIAVATLTRDRLPYTQHCFRRLREHAGCDYDHYVLDQGSGDGTVEWLRSQPVEILALNENIGISRGFNLLFDEAFNPADYDVIVRFDNDCELVQPDTLKTVCELALQGGAILSPRILGLNNPPPVLRELRIGDEIILDIAQIGGIFQATPAWLYHDGVFRYRETNPTWGLDDVDVCGWWRNQGGTVGYVKRFEAWHYESTNAQAQRFPAYHQRKLLEMAA